MHEAAKAVRQQELLRLIVAGFMLRECAPRLRLSYWTVRKYAKEPGFLEELKGLSMEMFSRVDAEIKASKDEISSISQRLQEESGPSLEKLVALRDESANESIQLKASSDLLDRVPEASKTRRVEGLHGHIVVTAEDLVRAAQAAQEEDEHRTKPNNGTGGNGQGGGTPRQLT